MREATAAIMEHNVTQPTYTKAEAFRCHGGVNESRTDVCVCVCVCTPARLCAAEA